MKLEQAIMERKSIRAFTKDPLPRDVIEEVLQQAIQAPSAINLQPWEFTVISGEEKERLSNLLLKSYREKRISCSPGAKGPLPAQLSARGEQSFATLNPALDELGLSFNDFINEGSCRFYDAPVAIIICMNTIFSHRRYLCIGAALGYLTLAAHARGLGTCPIGLINAYEDQLREFLDIPDDREIVIGVALGYPDWNSPINRLKTPRAPLGEFIRWFD
ncbi:MAG: nitroreductase [Deltaproteobacteria bacterium]|nr:nitroreductase [Deltaproteobacteria bacterium]